MSANKNAPERLTDHDVEVLARQTPCLCGSIESWHPECYRGKTDAQIRDGYRIAFNKARRTLRQRAQTAANAAIAKATGEQQ